MTFRLTLKFLGFCLLPSAFCLCAFAQGPSLGSFTYQGVLSDAGGPANGLFDFQFSLYPASTGTNSQVDTTLFYPAVSVSNGLFAVSLDFPMANSSFDGNDRWFEIAVKPVLGTNFVTLSPRQKITATPYAIAAGNLSGTISASQLSGAIPLGQLPAAIVTNNQSGVNFTGTFAGNGGSLSNLTSEKLTGTLTVSLGTPVSIGNVSDGGYAHGVAVSGNFAYLASSVDGLRVYNIANPANPVSIGHINDGGAAVGVAVSGNFAYLANGLDGLRIYNIANPTNPVSIGHINDGGAARGVAVSGNFAYLANNDDGLRVYNIVNPTNPVSIGHIDNGGFANGVAVSGNFAYLANYSDGLRIYNIANPTNPVSIGHSYDGGAAWAVAVSGNFAYLANMGDGLRIYDIANPTNPVSIGHINDGGNALGVAVSGNFAYLANEGGGLWAYNIANPANPVSIGHINDGGSAWGVAVSGNFAYLANYNDGLRVYGLQVASALGFRGDGSLLTGLNADNITRGTLNAARIPNLDASKITTGTLDDVRLSANVARLSASQSFTGNNTIAPPATLSFGARTRQMLNLWNNDYGIGVQSGTLYQRSNFRFSWFRAGTHSDNENDPGAGGTRLMTIDGNGEFHVGGGIFAGLSLQNRETPDFVGGPTAGERYVWYVSQGICRLWSGNDKMSVNNNGVVTAFAFNPTSDRAVKENFEPINGREVLEKVTALPITRWNFKKDTTSEHIGPMAQDFHATFGLNGNDDKHIATVDADGVALAAIQGLNQKLEELKSELNHRDVENGKLKRRLAELERNDDEREARLARLEKAVEAWKAGAAISRIVDRDSSP